MSRIENLWASTRLLLRRLSRSQRVVLIHNRNIIAKAYLDTLLAQGHKIVVIESEADKGAPYIAEHKDNPNIKIVPLIKPGERIESPAKAWIDPNRILDIMYENDVTDIVVGYGFLAENPTFAGICRALGYYKFHGPSPEILRLLGSKYNSKVEARKADMEVADFSDLVKIGYLNPPAGTPLDDIDRQKERAWEQLRAGVEQAGGYPVMLKADEGGGGRGQRRCNNENDLKDAFETIPGEALKFFGSPNIFLEKFVEAAPGANIHHIEVQFARDKDGLSWFSPRECSMQISRQKVLEMTADFTRLLGEKWKAQGLSASEMADRAHELECKIFNQCERLINNLGYVGIGTAEFLFDTSTETFRFMEVNPRIQVEHGVTEEAESRAGARLDLKLIQLQLTDNGSLRDHEICRRQSEYREQHNGEFPRSMRRFAIEARVNAVNTAQRIAATGLVKKFSVPPQYGVRVDSGIDEDTYVTGKLDPHVANIIATAETFDAAHSLLKETLAETVLIGVNNNLDFLRRTLDLPEFASAQYDIGYLDKHQRYLGQAEELDGLANYIAYKTVNPSEGKRLTTETTDYTVTKPVFDPAEQDRLIVLAQKKKSEFLHAVADRYKKAEAGALPFLVTDTSLRDAPQSNLAARMLASTFLGALPYYQQLFNPDPAAAGIVSIEAYGGATFDTAFRFSHMIPQELLRMAVSLAPEIPIQALFRGSNVLGYSSQPDNVVKHTVRVAHKNGLDKTRVFDSLNNPYNAEVSIREAVEAGMYVSGAVCYVDRPLHYFVKKAREYQALGCHQIDIKDMAGIGKPQHVAAIIKAIKAATGLPVGYHTHDTSTWAAATIHEAIKAGVDVLDFAVDSMANGSSQASLNAALRFEKESGRVPKIDISVVDDLSKYYTRDLEEYASRYADPAAAIKSLVDRLGLPGGQISNLIAQARGTGLESHEDIDAVFSRDEEFRD